VYPDGKPLSPLSHITLCVIGVQQRGGVSIEIRGPDGQARKIVAKPLNGTVRVETLLPAGPAGRYEIYVTTPEEYHYQTRLVSTAKGPQLHHAPVSPRPGRVVLLGLVGLPRRRTITLHLYRLVSARPISGELQRREHHRYRGTIRIRTDALGLAEARLRLDRGVPKGRYFLGSRPGDWFGHFDVK
jgi:hypothetical protein